MNLQWTPMRWPPAWKSPDALSLLKDSAINCLIVDPAADPGGIADHAKRAGMGVVNEGAHPLGVIAAQGEWPGIQMAARGGGGVSAGPTGVPWINSNGWKVRLQAALNPGSEIWIDAPPKGRVLPDGFAMAFLDAAAFGGRWIISLDEATASGIAAGEARAVAGWKKLAAAAAFFDARKDWAAYLPQAVVGVVSTFRGDNEFLSGETLNLLGRANQQYRIILRDPPEEAWKGLRAILYVDSDPPSPALRRQIETQVEAGKMLIAGPKWGAVSGSLAKDQEHPRYEIRQVGKGKIAIAREEPSDPYELANDSVLLVSHRYELLRFYNAGAEVSYLTAPADGKRAALHLLLYANRGPQDASVHLAGRYRAATLRSVDQPDGQKLEVQPSREGSELHFPPLAQYAAVELEA